MPRRSLSLISLFTGAGGLDLGFEAAGFETRVAVENDADAIKTLEKNRTWPLVAADIHSGEGSSANLLQLAELEPGEADILIGGPPCQPFSKSGYWVSGDSRRLEDPRASTLAAYLRVLKETKPKVFLLENVPGLAFSNKDEGLEFLRREIAAINRETGIEYTFSTALLNAADFGVPQERQRVFVVGQREGLEFSFPKPTHARNSGSLIGAANRQSVASSEPYLTAWDAIGEYEDDDSPDLRVTGKWADLLPTIPEGMNYLFHTARGEGEPLFGWRRRYWSFLLKLSKSLPSWTIAAQPGPAIGPFHWKNRRLSRRELACLQTFPDGYRIEGSMRAVQKQLGNAVPSALAERLALHIRGTLFSEPSALDAPLSLLPARRFDRPAPEPVLPLPEKYANLRGVHAAHPGTGLGYAATARR
jgi:DNA (cytosine-5)-methyltransferase 1